MVPVKVAGPFNTAGAVASKSFRSRVVSAMFNSLFTDPFNVSRECGRARNEFWIRTLSLAPSYSAFRRPETGMPRRPGEMIRCALPAMSFVLPEIEVESGDFNCAARRLFSQRDNLFFDVVPEPPGLHHNDQRDQEQRQHGHEGKQDRACRCQFIEAFPACIRCECVFACVIEPHIELPVDLLAFERGSYTGLQSLKTIGLWILALQAARCSS